MGSKSAEHYGLKPFNPRKYNSRDPRTWYYAWRFYGTECDGGWCNGLEKQEDCPDYEEDD